jgi:hypothetical protein
MRERNSIRGGARAPAGGGVRYRRRSFPFDGDGGGTQPGATVGDEGGSTRGRWAGLGRSRSVCGRTQSLGFLFFGPKKGEIYTTSPRLKKLNTLRFLYFSRRFDLVFIVSNHRIVAMKLLI